MGALIELCVTDTVPALDASADLHHLQQGIWGGVHAGKKQMGGVKGLGHSRVPTVNTSTIQLASRMCPGAGLARRVQEMSRPWLIS